LKKKISPSKFGLKNLNLDNSFHTYKKQRGREYQSEIRGTKVTTSSEEQYHQAIGVATLNKRNNNIEQEEQ